MVGQPGAADNFAGSCQGLLALGYAANSVVELGLVFFPHFFEQLAQGGNQRNDPCKRRVAGCAAFYGVDGDFVAVPIHVAPEGVFHFGNAAAGETQETDQIGTILRLARARCFDFLQ